MPAIRVQFMGIEEQVSALIESVERYIPQGLEKGLESTAQYAREHHPYQNRTGDLQASTGVESSTGDLASDTLTGIVSATMDYASYVDEKDRFSFLLPAWVNTEDFVVQSVDQAIFEAIADAAWGADLSGGSVYR